MSSLTFKKVNALPLTYTPSTMYMVKTARPGIAEIFISDNTGTSVMHLSTSEDILQESVLFSVTAPSTDTTSKFWWKTDTGALFVLYDDGTDVNWVEASPSIAVPEFDGNGTANTMARSDHWHDSLVLQEAAW